MRSRDGARYTQKVAQDFSAAATHYDDFAELQREVVDFLLPWVKAEKHILDAGAGTGYAMQPHWQALDIAEGMCRVVEGSVCADMQRMPFADEGFDGVFSSLAMQWTTDPSLFMREAHRCTNDQGELVVTTLGCNTLSELRQSFVKAGFFVPLLPFLAQDELRLLITESGWRLQQMETRMMTTSHDSVMALLQHLKGLGARHKAPRQAGLMGRKWLETLEDVYPNRHSLEVEASWEVICFKAVKP